MIRLGQSSDDPLSIDLDRLIGSHACVIANSGGGKSTLIRRLVEVTHGQVQQIILDPEDEFYSLRERCEFVIAGGDGGDIPASVENAATLALTALRHGFSLIVQLNDMGEDAPRFVGDFLDALISAPRDLWHPLLVILDETQRFAPSEGQTAATHGVRALSGQGRKRGFTGIFASQRIAKVDPNVRGDVNNWMLGRVGQSLDRKTVADALGFPPSSAEARGLQGLEDCTFWGFGPAISRQPVHFTVDQPETTRVRPGQAKVATPPAPEALREILAGLAVAKLEATDPAKAIPDRGADYAEAMRQVSDLRGHLEAMERRALEAEAIAAPFLEFKATMKRVVEQINGAFANIKEIRIAVPEGGERHVTSSAARAIKPKPAAPSGVAGTSSNEVAKIKRSPEGPSPAATAIADLLDRVNPAKLTWNQAASMTGRKASGGNFNAARKWLRESGRIVEEGDLVRSANDEPTGLTREEAFDLWKSVLSNPAPKMLDALWGSEAISKETLGELIGAQPRGGNFNNGLAQLRRNGLLYDCAWGSFRLADPLPGEAQ